MQTLCLKGEHFKAQRFKDIFLPVNVCSGKRSRDDRHQTDRKCSMQESRNMVWFIAYGFATVLELFTDRCTAFSVVHSRLYFQTERYKLRCLAVGWGED